MLSPACTAALVATYACVRACICRMKQSAYNCVQDYPLRELSAVYKRSASPTPRSSKQQHQRDTCAHSQRDQNSSGSRTTRSYHKRGGQQQHQRQQQQRPQANDVVANHGSLDTLQVPNSRSTSQYSQDARGNSPTSSGNSGACTSFSRASSPRDVYASSSTASSTSISSLYDSVSSLPHMRHTSSQCTAQACRASADSTTASCSSSPSWKKNERKIGECAWVGCLVACGGQPGWGTSWGLALCWEA